MILIAQIQVLSRSAPPSDVSWAALISALSTTMIPVALPPSEDFASTVKFSATEKVPLRLNFSGSPPWCTNLGVTDNGLVIADLDGEIEEESVEGRVSVIIAESSDILNLSVSSGSTEITTDNIRQCIQLARVRAADLYLLLKENL